MCELLGLSSNTSVDIRFSLSGLFQRGGHTGIHADGWGLGLYQGKSAHIYKDSRSSIESELAQHLLLGNYKSKTIIAHIRKANRGKVCQENTHPFRRELWGKEWLFAHNGQLKGIKKKSLQHFCPVGTTDSEYAFCFMLDRLKERFPEKPPTNKALMRAIESLCHEINALGVFNIILSDSSRLYTFCGKRMCYLTRQYPFQTARLVDTPHAIDLSLHNHKEDRMILIASKPITLNENWITMEKGEFRVYSLGNCLYESHMNLQSAA